jgi:peptidyl-tRNA hydrolase
MNSSTHFIVRAYATPPDTADDDDDDARIAHRAPPRLDALAGGGGGATRRANGRANTRASDRIVRRFMSTARLGVVARVVGRTHAVDATHRARATSTVAFARRGARAMAAVANDAEDPLVQFIIIRKDLGRQLAWPLGALAAQCAHASVHAVWTYRDSADTAAYVSRDNISSMRKVVLETKNAGSLDKLAATLDAEGVEHVVWVEQPEGIRTCLATRPYRRSAVGGYFKKCNLASDVCVAKNAAAATGTE